MIMEKILREKLIGEQLSSVEFIQDYLQLHFDGRNFIIYIWPKVSISEKNYCIDDIEYRNMLCKLISSTIIDIVYIESKKLKIVFDKYESSISINLDNYNLDIISEIVIFNDTLDNSWSVFE